MPKSMMILRKVFREQECNKQEMAQESDYKIMNLSFPFIGIK
jgi:hypothetical protein